MHEFAGKLLSVLPQVLMLLDDERRVIWVKKAFFETFVVGAEVLGRPLEALWPDMKSHAELYNALDATISGGPSFAALWVSNPFERKAPYPMRFSAQRIPAEGGRPAVTLVVMEEAMQAMGTAP